MSETDVASLPTEKVTKLCCIGAGYVGGPTCAIIARNCPEIRVTVVDKNAERIRAWRTPDALPISEPGLQPIIAAQLSKNLFFSTNIAEAVRQADIILLAVNTPTKTFGKAAGQMSNLAYFESAARLVAEEARGNKIVVEKSTVPVKTGRMLQNIFRSSKHGAVIEVLSNPEFLAEGTAVENLQNPDRVIIGRADTPAGRRAAQRLKEVYAHWVPQERILTDMNIWSSELAKLASNALLAQRVSNANALAAVCEKVGARVDEVVGAVGRDERIGNKFMGAGVGFGGSCFRKDVSSLIYLCRTLNLPEVANYWQCILDINSFSQNRFLDHITSHMHNSVYGKTISILGFAFKANTGDTRESPAIKICQSLLEEGVKELRIYDPKVRRHQIYEDLWGCQCQVLSPSPDPGELPKAASTSSICKQREDEDQSSLCLDDNQSEASSDGFGSSRAVPYPSPPDTPSTGPSAPPSRPKAASKSACPATKHLCTCPLSSKVSIHTSALSANQSSDAVVILTDWDEFKTLDWESTKKVLTEPGLVFDGRGVVDRDRLEELGLQVYTVGDGSES